MSRKTRRLLRSASLAFMFASTIGFCVGVCLGLVAWFNVSMLAFFALGVGLFPYPTDRGRGI